MSCEGKDDLSHIFFVHQLLVLCGVFYEEIFIEWRRIRVTSGSLLCSLSWSGGVRTNKFMDFFNL